MLLVCPVVIMFARSYVLLVIIIQNVLVAEDVLESYFACHLDACRGACCWEGDYGAPLELEEIKVLEQMANTILHLLPLESQEEIKASGAVRYYPVVKKWGTNLRPDGACVFMLTNAQGIASCGIEKYNAAGLLSGQKPVSCQLYPLRVVWQGTFETLQYDRWDICQPGCVSGSENKIPLINFVKTGLIRRYGQEFYAQLDDIARHWRQHFRD